MSSQPEILICDGPGQPLEDLLPDLRGMGYRCTYTPDAAKVVRGAPPSLILLAAETPGGPRGAGFKHLREIYPQTPVVVIAGIRSLTNVIDYFRVGATDYLPAPTETEELRERLAAALAEAPAVSSADPVEVPVDYARPKLEKAQVSRNGSVPLEALPCGALVLDGEGALRKANRAALRLLGQSTTAELAVSLHLGLERYDLIDAAGAPLAPELWPPYHALRARERAAATVGLKRGVDDRIWLKIEAEPRLMEGEVAELFVTLTDVSPPAAHECR